jgi:hypothetical protein
MADLYILAPGYAPGFIITTITSIVAAVLAVVYRYVCLWENKRRDKKGVEAFDHAYEDDLTDMKVSLAQCWRKTSLTQLLQNPQFRYQV